MYFTLVAKWYILHETITKYTELLDQFLDNDLVFCGIVRGGLYCQPKGRVLNLSTLRRCKSDSRLVILES